MPCWIRIALLMVGLSFLVGSVAAAALDFVGLGFRRRYTGLFTGTFLSCSVSALALFYYSPSQVRFSKRYELSTLQDIVRYRSGPLETSNQVLQPTPSRLVSFLCHD